VAETPGDALTARLAAEIRTIGFDVQEVPPPAVPGIEALEALGRPLSAIAVVRVLPLRAGGAEVWVVDRVTGKTVIRRVPGRLDAGRPDGLVALRAVELLRGSLLEIRLPSAPRGEVAPPPAVEAVVAADLATPPPTTPRLALAVYPGLAVSPGGLPALFGSQAQLALSSASGWGGELSAFVPHVPARVSGPEGQARVDLFMAGAGGRWATRPGRRMGAHFGVGFTGLWLRMNGQSNAALYEGRQDVVAAVAPYARAAASVALTSWLRAGVQVMAGATVPWPAVSFADRRVASWGLPFGVAGVGLEFGGR
jgi:hypothetical protein